MMLQPNTYSVKDNLTKYARSGGFIWDVAFSENVLDGWDSGDVRIRRFCGKVRDSEGISPTLNGLHGITLQTYTDKGFSIFT